MTAAMKTQNPKKSSKTSSTSKVTRKYQDIFEDYFETGKNRTSFCFLNQ